MVAIENIFVKYIKLRNKLDKAKIYKIVDNTNDNKYIGSTCQSLKTRLSVHKNDYKRFLKGLYNNIRSFGIIKNNDYKIELLEKCDIKTKQELASRERYFIENNECVNKVIPGRSHKESVKAYNDTNKDEINEKFDCECGGKYTHANKSAHIKSNKHLKFIESLK